MKSGIELIADERGRQIGELRQTAAMDDAQTDCQLVSMALVYAEASAFVDILDEVSPDEREEALDRITATFRGENAELSAANLWPDSRPLEYMKISSDPIRNLVKAGALIAAEIDRLKRKNLRENGIRS